MIWERNLMFFQSGSVNLEIVIAKWKQNGNNHARSLHCIFKIKVLDWRLRLTHLLWVVETQVLEPWTWSNWMVRLFEEKDTGISYKRQKPVELYSQLIEVFSKDKCLHIIDACSGAGSCPLACSSLSRKCIILEKCPVKARMIRQRVNIA